MAARIDLSQWPTVLARQLAELRPAVAAALAASAPEVEAAARGRIGHEHADWPPLKPATIAEKERLGYEVPAPLLREGELRDSYHAVAEDLTLAVGSNDPVALYQELGTSRGIPPRAVSEPALIDSLPAAGAAIGATLVKVLETV